jgi:hypothetical protein
LLDYNKFMFFYKYNKIEKQFFNIFNVWNLVADNDRKYGRNMQHKLIYNYDVLLVFMSYEVWVIFISMNLQQVYKPKILVKLLNSL